MPYDELVKRLWECASGECFNCSQYTETTNASVCSKELMKQAADAIEERCQQVDKFAEEAARLYAKQPRWIPVTERLPEERDNYLVLTEELENYVCDFIPSVKQWWTVPGDTFLIDVTHWMPLPEPPKEG